MNKFGMISAVTLIASAGQVLADDLSVVCSAEQDWCDLMVAAFEAAHPGHRRVDGAQIHR